MNSSHIRRYLQTTTLAPIWEKLTEQDIDFLLRGRSILRKDGSSYSEEKILVVYLKNFNKLSESFRKKLNKFTKILFKNLLNDDFDVSNSRKKYYLKLMKIILKTPHLNSSFSFEKKLLFANKLDQLKNSQNKYTKLVIQDAGDKKNDLLFNACLRNKLTIAKILIDNGVEINKPRKTVGNTPLNICCEHNNLEIAKLLIDKGARFGTLVSKAIKFGNYNFAKLLIQHGGKVDSSQLDDTELLLWSCVTGDIEIVKRLVEEGMSVNIFDACETTPLHLASQYGHLECVKYLLANGANIDAYDNYTPLYLACIYGHLEVVRSLINNGAKVDIPNYLKATPLHIACQRGNFEIAKLLIKAGANIEIRDSKSRTPSHLAVVFEHYEVTELLLENKAQIDARDKKNRTLLHLACSVDNLKIVKLLIENGANVNTCDSYNHPPITYTSDQFVYQLLKENGADFFQMTEDGIQSILYSFFGNNHEKTKDLEFEGWTPQYATMMINEILDSWKVLEQDDDLLEQIKTAFINSISIDSKNFCEKIKEQKELVFVPAGWKGHNMYIAFFHNYICLINRGETWGHASSFSLYRFDPEKMTPDIMQKILDLSKDDAKSNFVEVELIKILKCQNDEITNNISQFIKENKMFKEQEKYNCSIANAKPFVFFAKLFEKTLSPQRKEMEESHAYYKDFTRFAREYVLEKIERNEP